MGQPIKLQYPVGTGWVVTQDYQGHVARAKENGWCTRPGSGCSAYYYPGIDWGVMNGTPVNPAMAGTVIKAGLDPTTAANPNRGYGNRVQIAHVNGWQTIYAHLQEVRVSVGQQVDVDQVIGLTDNTGYSTGPHIHFELRDEQGVPIDPTPYFAPATPESLSPSDTQGSAVYRVIVPILNLRAAPHTSSAVLERLPRGTLLKVKSVLKREIWLEVDGGFCAAVYAGEPLAEKVE